MKYLTKKIIFKILPPTSKIHLTLRYQYRNFIGSLDAEMLFVDKLLKNRRRFVDIGANIGIYSFHFSSSFSRIDAFEPIEEITHGLKLLSNKSVVTHNVALSNTDGKIKYHVPIIDGALVPGKASLEPRKGQCEERFVSVKRLDDYTFSDVDLIKIDVEGHESSVLEGAINTILKNKPILIVEIEQRHIRVPINDVFQKYLSLGYDGYFLQNDELKSIDVFLYADHQEPYLSNVKDKRYVNNFIFKPL